MFCSLLHVEFPVELLLTFERKVSDRISASVVLECDDGLVCVGCFELIPLSVEITVGTIEPLLKLFVLDIPPLILLLPLGPTMFNSFDSHCNN